MILLILACVVIVLIAIQIEKKLGRAIATVFGWICMVIVAYVWITYANI